MTKDPLSALAVDPDALSMRELVTLCVDVWTELAQLVDEAAEVQSLPSPIPRPAEDTSERGKGGHGDPTFAVVQDARRMAVREFVLDSIRAASSLKHRGERALDRWAGLA